MEKSSRPSSVRSRLRRANQRVDRTNESMADDIEMLFEKPVQEWDWEELSRGRPRDPNGQFHGRKPTWITATVEAEARRRMRQLTEDKLMTHAQSAIAVLTDMMTDTGVDDFGKPTTPASVRADAAKYIINHVVGTPKARMEVDASSPVRELLADVLVNPDGEESHMVIEGSVEDEEDLDDDEDIGTGGDS